MFLFVLPAVALLVRCRRASLFVCRAFRAENNRCVADLIEIDAVFVIIYLKNRKFINRFETSYRFFVTMWVEILHRSLLTIYTSNRREKLKSDVINSRFSPPK
jgi:hypothetical protein